MWIKNVAKKIFFGHKSDSQTYIEHLRKVGVNIGERVVIYDPRSVCIDETRPFLVSIGNDVKITRGVTILTHGYDWSVLAGVYDRVLGSAGAVSIGNNIFIGMNSTILKGVTIGDNVIIGANSLVNKDIPANSVVAGNPAKVICSIDDYYRKRISAQKEEAFALYIGYVTRFGKEPPMDAFDEFFWLFQRRDDELHPKFARQMSWGDNFDAMIDNLKRSEPEFDGYDAFLEEARQKFEDNSNRRT